MHVQCHVCALIVYVYLCRVNHSKNAIVKPQGPTPQEERREVEEAMKRIKEANQAIAKAMDTEPVPPSVGKYIHKTLLECETSDVVMNFFFSLCVIQIKVRVTDETRRNDRGLTPTLDRAPDLGKVSIHVHVHCMYMYSMYSVTD